MNLCYNYGVSIENERSRQVPSNPNLLCPPEILKQQVAVEVGYLAFDGTLRIGVIEVNKLVADDVKAFFEQAVALDFPIEKVAPASDTAYQWNDDTLMEANVSSGFNYRLVAGTDAPSLHGKGLYT